jgi:hypothetical protein
MQSGSRLWLICGALCLVALASISAFDQRMREASAAHAYSGNPYSVVAKPSQHSGAKGEREGRPAVYTREELCSTAALVAVLYNLPVPFFANLIWQESGFQSHVVSTAGAQGIAQFMPATAAAYGLANPFDPIHALVASGRLLSNLQTQFGNLGLAAAAYNAGPKRVTDWIANRGPLPGETRHYVHRITGRPAEHWASVAANTADHLMPQRAPCIEVANALEVQAQAQKGDIALAKKLSVTPATTTKPAVAAPKLAKRKLVLVRATVRAAKKPKLITAELEKPSPVKANSTVVVRARKKAKVAATR